MKKVSLSDSEIKHVAELAKLKLTESELKKFQGQLSKIVDYVSKLQQLDTSGITPTSQVTELENIFREDEIIPSIPQKEALSQAKKTYNGYFVTEAVFE
ncbi:hypothetical protein A2Y99_00530 [Candidatus Gottesmanbacteria bacterium RBG_13_37_7]|uniref:Aspartyl/glutamyl-tRNA(Asn/Gln) amidotransferase subunit C n=1 Tax=Candidatus Gottesmanbacteria bacterium RBG_13_37_7 TaxID=1798369 RepID=A0A1F5YI49_9BACT|nr:MAG: hypothetical protein A2Y99_00530 [Candidatus Gottesmanbacteria bacterium RBG_13_37_7]